MIQKSNNTEYDFVSAKSALIITYIIAFWIMMIGMHNQVKLKFSAIF